MKKYNLGMVLATATLIFGGCKNANNVDIIELDSSEVEVTQNLLVDSEEIKELVESDDNEEMDEVDNELIDMELLVSTESSSSLSSSNKSTTSTESSSSLSSSNKSTISTGSSSSSSSSNKSTTSTGSSSSSSSSSESSNSGSSSSESSNSGSSNSGSSNSGSSNSGSSNPTPPVVEETKKPVDILDWNYIKSTLITKGQSLGMIYEPSMNRELDGWESPWQSSYMPVTNEDVIGYIGTKMERCANSGFQYFNLEMVVQSDGNVLIYLIR